MIVAEKLGGFVALSTSAAAAPPSGPAIGSRAPTFTLMCTQGPGTARQVSLADFENRWLALLFYAKDFSLV